MTSVSAQSAFANPTGATVVNGSATFSQPNSSTLAITNSPGAIINWQQFNIGHNEVTRFIQQNASSAVLNRVTGLSPSEIFGALNSNGRVFLVNGNGILFGPNATINTSGFIASTLNISDNDFLNGRLHFEDLANNAELLNQGFIHTSNAGEVILVAPNIKNEGVINVEQGKLVLAAGQSVTINSLNYDNIEFEVQAPEHSVVNLGEMISDGGSIGVFAGSISNAGNISANAITVDAAGNIRFVAQDDVILQQGSQLTASSSNGDGGAISIDAHADSDTDKAMLLQNGDIRADGINGGNVDIDVDVALTSATITARGVRNGGTVHMQADNITSVKSSYVSADGGRGEGGSIDINANERLLTSATYSARGMTGGQINLLGANTVSLASATLLADGIFGGGDIRVGGGFQGGEGLITARNTLINENTLLSSRAIFSGNGGTAVVWSDEETWFAGTIAIDAGSFGGDGGFAEVSSKGAFAFGGTVTRSAPHGEVGTLLLDPVDINITAGGGGGLSFIELIDPANIANGDNFGGSFDLFTAVNNNATLTLTVAPLSNGNTVIVNNTDNNGTGAAYMFDPAGGLITTLTGSTTTDQVGTDGASLVGLFDSVVIGSSEWNGTVGAWTFIDGNTGEIGGSGGPTTGFVSNANSLVGSTPGDGSGATVTRLFNTDGDYVVALPNWDDPGQSILDAGSVTWASGVGTLNNAGDIGTLTNSITGASDGDNIGTIIATSFDFFNPFFMVGSPTYDSALATDGGIAFLVDSTGNFAIGGGTGQVTDSRGLFGDDINDNISSGGIYTVGSTRGDFVVASPNDDHQSLSVDGGSVTFISVTTTFGEIGGTGEQTASPNATNSLIGDTSSDRVGSGSIYSPGVVSLEGANNFAYLVVSSDWSNGNINDSVGAVTWGTGPVTGTVSTLNSITGENNGDEVGELILPLANGNFAVGSSRWTDAGAGTNLGAVTIGNGATGEILSANSFGPITKTNSLFGATDFDFIGGNNGLVGLENGNLVVISQNWANGAATSAGAVTLINGSTGEIASQSLLFGATPDATNSIIGLTTFDFIGSSVADIGNGNFAIISESWNNGSATVGAVTLADGTDGSFVIGTPGSHGGVSALNSFTGSTGGDLVDAQAFALNNGHFIVAAPAWDDFAQTIVNVGAVVHVNGTTGEIGGSGSSTGVISPTNSLVGSSANDNISGEPIDGYELFVLVLDSGDYVFGSPLFDDAANSFSDAGAITIGNGATGSVGFLDSSNSIIGDNSDDRYGSGNFIETFDGTGRFIAHNPDADSGGFTDNGNVFLVDPNAAATPANNISFGDNPGGSLGLTAADIEAQLAQGNLVLQASNDIILELGADIFVNAGGFGGNLTLQAGRSISLNADIVTDNGKLVLVANDPSAIAIDRVAGVAEIRMVDGTTIDTGSGNLEIWMRNGVNTPASGGDDIILANIITDHMIITNNSLSDASDVLRTATGDITATSFFINHDGPNGGTIGTGAAPLNITSDDIGAHIHGNTGGGGEGIFINATHNGSGTVTVGNSCYGRGDAAFGCDTFGPHTIRGIQTQFGGNIQLNFLNSNVQVFALDDSNQYGINGTDAFVNITIGNGFFRSDANITNTAGNLSIFGSGNVSLDNGAGRNPVISNSFGDIGISTGNGGSFTMAAGTQIIGSGSPGAEINIDTGANITLGNVNAAGYSVILSNTSATGTGDITTIPATSIIAESITADSDTGIDISTQVNFLDLNASGADILVDNTSASLELTNAIITGSAITNLIITNTGDLIVSGSVQQFDGNISLESITGALSLNSGIFMFGGTTIDVLAANGLTVQSTISAPGALITLDGDTDGDLVGGVTIVNNSGATLDIASSNSINITGAFVSIAGGNVAGEDILIESLNGDVDIDASNGDVTIDGGTANNTGVVIRGNQSGVTDVSILASGDFFLRAGTGASSSASIESSDTDTEGVSINATNITIDNTGAGTDSDAFINASNGTTNATLVSSGNCNGCVAVIDPAGTAGSQFGIWALNFPVGGSLIVWDGGGGSDDSWTTAINWVGDVVPTVGDSVSIGLFTPTITSTVDSIVNLSLDGGTLILADGGGLSLTGNITVINDGSITLLASTSSLNIAGNASITGTATNVDVDVQGGTFDVGGTFSSTGIVNIGGSAMTSFGNTATFNELNVASAAVATLNGLNNTISTFNLISGATLNGTGNTDVNGPFNWSESTVSHNLTVNGDMTVPFITGNAILDGGIVTLANTGGTRSISNAMDIRGNGELSNNDALGLDESASIRSSDGTGRFTNRDTGSLTYNSTSATFNMGVGTGLRFVTAGDIDAMGGTFNVTTTTPMEWNGGMWMASAGGGFAIDTAMSMNGAATKTIDGINFVSSQPINILLGDGDIDIINGGSFTVGAGGPVTHTSNGDITSSDVSGTFTNNGTFENTAGTTEFVGIAMANTGQLDVSGGSLTFSTGLANGGSSVVNVSAGTLVLNEAGGPTDDPGDYLVNGTGEVQILTDRNLTGNFDFSAGSVLINGANVDFSGVPAIVDIMDLVLNGGGSISGDALSINNNFDWIAGAVNSTTLDIQSGAVMNVSDSAAIASDFTNDGQTNILNGGALRLIVGNSHAGAFNIATGGALDVDTGTHTFNGALGGGGTLIISNSTSDLVLQTNSTVGNLQMLDGILRGNGNLDVTNVSTWSGGSMSGTGSTSFNAGVNILGPVTLDRVLNTNGGSIDGFGAVSDGISGTAAFNLSGGVFTVVDSGNTHLVDTGITINTGATLDVQGTLYVQLASIGVTNNGGTLSGSGSIIGDVFNNGILSPGNSPGAMLIDGDLTLLSNSLLNLDVEGITTAGVDYDLLDVTGQIIFGGAMAVIIPQDSPTLKLQDNFSPVTYSSSTGQFQSITASPGYAFRPIFGPNGLVLEATSVPGLALPRDPSTDIVNLTNSFDLAEFFEDMNDLLVKVDADDDDEEETGTLVCS